MVKIFVSSFFKKHIDTLTIDVWISLCQCVKLQQNKSNDKLFTLCEKSQYRFALSV